jgi:hypothetical protein
VFTRHLSLHATGTTPEPLSDLAISLDLCCLPPHNMGVDGFLLIRYRGECPFTCVVAYVLLVYALQCLFHVVFVWYPKRDFPSVPSFHRRSCPPTAQHSVLNHWLSFIEAVFTTCQMACASRRTWCQIFRVYFPRS